MIWQFVCCLLLLSMHLQAQDGDVVVRMIRCYGANDERLPPVAVINSSESNDVGSEFVTIEFDVAAQSIPNVYARITHCSADWKPSENGFLNDVTNRTSLVDWSIAPERSKYSRYRGKMVFPNPQTTIRFSGNWLVTLYDLSTDSVIGQTRFFAVDARASMRMSFMTDFYQPRFQVSSIAYTIEARVADRTNRLLNTNMHTLALYRNHRWNEPMYASETLGLARNPNGIGSNVVGMIQSGKVFRLERIPAQNEYRILDLTDMARYPFVGAPVRMPLSDMRRNGMFLERADDGAMTSQGIVGANDEFVPVEILLDPNPGGISREDVFVVGSFNNWKPDKSWMMWYDESLNLYRLRQWLRRGRHNYLYATGRLNADTDQIMDLCFEEFEGNTASANNSFIAFAYSRELDYGGYDGIVAVGSSTMYLGR